MKIPLTLLAICFVIIGFANFFSFLNEIEHLGGDANNGYVKDGHFFVISHGKLKEISEADWKHNKKHGRSVIITHPLAILSIGYLLFQFAFPTMLYRGNRQMIEERAFSLSKSDLIAKLTCGGRIGWTNFRGPLLKVFLHREGLIIKPLFMDRFGIDFSQINNIQFKEGRFRIGVEICHSSQQIASPIFLDCSPSDEFVSKLQLYANKIGQLK
jgi:hypothetical protein